MFDRKKKNHLVDFQSCPPAILYRFGDIGERKNRCDFDVLIPYLLLDSFPIVHRRNKRRRTAPGEIVRHNFYPRPI